MAPLHVSIWHATKNTDVTQPADNLSSISLPTLHGEPPETILTKQNHSLDCGAFNVDQSSQSTGTEKDPHRCNFEGGVQETSWLPRSVWLVLARLGRMYADT